MKKALPFLAMAFSGFLVYLFDKIWGTVPKKDNPDDLSITALEYMEAKELGLPVFILVSGNRLRIKFPTQGSTGMRQDSLLYCLNGIQA